MTPLEKNSGLESHWDDSFRPELQNSLSALEHVINNGAMTIGLSLNRIEKARISGDSAKVEEKLQVIEDTKNSMIKDLVILKEALASSKLNSENGVNPTIIESLINFLQSKHELNKENLQTLKSFVEQK